MNERILTNLQKLAAIEQHFALELFPPRPDHPDWVEGVLVRATNTSHGDIQEVPPTRRQLIHVCGTYKERYSRIAFALYHGWLPDEMVDHHDGDTNNNRLDNLRPATAQQNAMNRGRVPRKDGFQLPRGVRSHVRKDGRTVYEARGFENVNGKRRWKSLGRFETLVEAFSVAEEFRRKKHGEFYRPHQLNKAAA
jgi:hypothetical protein